jgi:hypothetical protein
MAGDFRPMCPDGRLARAILIASPGAAIVKRFKSTGDLPPKMKSFLVGIGEIVQL